MGIGTDIFIIPKEQILIKKISLLFFDNKNYRRGKTIQ
jgi:hypothetical protein